MIWMKKGWQSDCPWCFNKLFWWFHKIHLDNISKVGPVSFLFCFHDFFPPTQEILDLRANLDGLERERDYYFRRFWAQQLCQHLWWLWPARKLMNCPLKRGPFQTEAGLSGTNLRDGFFQKSETNRGTSSWFRDSCVRKLRDVEILCLELKAGRFFWMQWSFQTVRIKFNDAWRKLAKANMDPELKAEKVVEDVQGWRFAHHLELHIACLCDRN